MTVVKQQAAFAAGPYKGFHGEAEYDAEADLFSGRLLGTRDVITFQGRTVPEVAEAFCESVDDYLAWCEARGEKPDKPFSGKMLVRLPPALHKQLGLLADRSGVSLNTLIKDVLGSLAAASDPPLSQSRQPAIGAKQELRAVSLDSPAAGEESATVGSARRGVSRQRRAGELAAGQVLRPKRPRRKRK